MDSRSPGTAEELLRNLDRLFPEEPDGCLAHEELGVRVATFRSFPEPGLTTFLTLGMSEHVLEQADGEPIRQEFLAVARAPEDERSWVKCLLALATITLGQHAAPSRGQVADLRADLLQRPGGSLTGVLFLQPLILDEELTAFELADEVCVLAQVIPLTREETATALEQGAFSLVESFRDGEVDWLDICRTP